jgi:hypothetical protein
MNTKEIEETLKQLALEPKTGDEKQKAFGKRLHALALEMEEVRKASQTPLNEDNIKLIESGGSDPRLSPRRKWRGSGR